MRSQCVSVHMKTLLAFLFLFFGFIMSAQATTLHDFTLTGIDGKQMALDSYRGKVVLVVNTASECGYTPQYEGLEALWKEYEGQGLVIVGVPSNDFGGQEPGKAEEIVQFCKLNYGVTFPLADKTVVKGANAHALYQWAAKEAGMLGRPKWNFHKYLFGKNGQFVDWFSSQTEPLAPKLVKSIKTELAKD
jgi:glutathione peroxidase